MTLTALVASLSILAAPAQPVRPPAEAPREGAPAQPPAVAPAQPSPTTNYRGRITVGIGQEIAFFIKVASPTAATISVPAQGIENAPLTDVTATAERLVGRLALPELPLDAHPKFDIALNPDGSGRGSLRQAGAEAPVVVTRMAPDEAFGPRRPQNPQPPFPYDSREVVVDIAADGAKLAGTLTWPRGAQGARHPAVILITGSGSQDRDETLLTHKPFLVLADHLTRNGLAVLRLDDRGVGGSTSPTPDPTTLTFAGDVTAVVAFLKSQPEIDPARIGLIGHSEGGLVAPIVAAQSPDVKFIVMLAGTGVPGGDVLKVQMEAILRAGGAAAAVVERITSLQRTVLEAAIGQVKEEDLAKAIENLIVAQSNMPAEAMQDPDQKAQLATAVTQQVRAMRGPWFRTFMEMDPRVHLRKVTCPVLALNGALDTQVVASQNLPEIVKALTEAGNPDITAVVMPGLNHLFQTARTGSPHEYMLIDETFAPAALDVVTRWVRLRTGLDPWPALALPSALPLPEPGARPKDE